MSADGVALTLLAGTSAERGRHTAKRPIHYRFDRVCTVRELARLHGIPDSVELGGSKCDEAMRIGNSVPPPMGSVIAGAVMEGLELSRSIAA